MKKIAILTVIAILAIAGCKKKPDIEPEPTPDPVDVYEAFKADATPRWENGTTVAKNEDSDYIFIVDADESLFESAKYKTGYMTEDGSNYEIIEFSGAVAVGKPTSATLRKPSGSVNLNSLEIIKIDGSKLWIVFKETATSSERRIVQ